MDPLDLGRELAAAPGCWFGVSPSDGLPGMYCLSRGFALDVIALDVIAVIERLVVALGAQGQGTT